MDVRLFVFYPSHRLLWGKWDRISHMYKISDLPSGVQEEISHMGKNSGNPDLCAKNIGSCGKYEKRVRLRNM